MFERKETGFAGADQSHAISELTGKKSGGRGVIGP
jgi:hypothetical protein